MFGRQRRSGPESARQIAGAPAVAQSAFVVQPARSARRPSRRPEPVRRIAASHAECRAGPAASDAAASAGSGAAASWCRDRGQSPRRAAGPARSRSVAMVDAGRGRQRGCRGRSGVVCARRDPRRGLGRRGRAPTRVVEVEAAGQRRRLDRGAEGGEVGVGDRGSASRRRRRTAGPARTRGRDRRPRRSPAGRRRDGRRARAPAASRRGRSSPRGRRPGGRRGRRSARTSSRRRPTGPTGRRSRCVGRAPARAACRPASRGCGRSGSPTRGRPGARGRCRSRAP
jgi:hypothetical protein